MIYFYSPFLQLFCILFFFFLILFIYDSHTEREKQAETQAEGEAGSMHREPDVGFDPGSPGSRPGPKAGAKPLRHPGIPFTYFKETSPPGVDIHRRPRRSAVSVGPRGPAPVARPALMPPRGVNRSLGPEQRSVAACWPAHGETAVGDCSTGSCRPPGQAAACPPGHCDPTAGLMLRPCCDPCPVPTAARHGPGGHAGRAVCTAA